MEAAAADSPAERRNAAIQAFAEVLAPFETAACARCEEEELPQCLVEKMSLRYERLEGASADSAAFRERERTTLLRVADRWWMEHIDEMEQLRQCIGLVSYAQKDPLTEYKKEALRLFEEMNRNIRYVAAMAILREGSEEGA